MKLIKPSFEILEQGEGIAGIYKQIEIAGRTCYKSEDRITRDSAEKFVNAMIKSGHGAMLEHGTVYLQFNEDNIYNMKGNYITNPYSKFVERYGEGDLPVTYNITTNYRHLVENGWLDDLKYLCEPTEYHEKRIAVKFITDIGVTREANRHRVNSMAEQSTRFCNYSQDKFGNEISIALPKEFTEKEVYNSIDEFSDMDRDCFRSMCLTIAEYVDDNFGIIDTWLFANLACEWSYMRLIKLGWKPQQARRVLPLDTNSELVHTAFISDWKHFFSLRADGTTGKPHPDMEALAKPLKEEFIKRGYV